MIRIIKKKLVEKKFVNASAKRNVSTKLSEGFHFSEQAVAVTAVVGLAATAYWVITSIVSKDLKHIGEKIDKDFEIARNQSRSDFKVARDQLNTDFSGIREDSKC
jgi:hypothetical protein